MIKIMLVEDDKSLREIYGVRLLAEGYDIVTAGDGEEALAMAIKERPQLIISDVMMPKISGFDMLDILRSTTETRSIKVIMMTALSSEEQRTRGETLGADRYLVKSQVGIEDVVRVVHEVLGDRPAAAAAQPAATPGVTVPPRPQASMNPQTAVYGTAASTSLPTPTRAPQQAVPQPQPAPQPPQPSAPTTPAQPQPASSQPPTPPRPANATPEPPSLKNRVIQPLNEISNEKVDLNDLLNKEIAAPPAPQSPSNFASINDELESLNDQVNSFESQIAVDESGNFSPQPPTEQGSAPQPQVTPPTPQVIPVTQQPSAQPQSIPTPPPQTPPAQPPQAS